MTLAGLVALRKESVDRNLYLFSFALAFLLSLSARRAWIEISIPMHYFNTVITSLSARRAWIEIAIANTVICYFTGSLSARRAWIEITQCKL